jgi:hypothetical protein
LHGRSTASLDLLLTLLGLFNTLGEKFLVASFGFLGGLGASTLESLLSSLALKSDGGDKTLDLGSLGVGLLLGVLGLNLTTNDKLANVISLVQVEELADVVGTLGSKTLGNSSVGKAGDVLLTLLDNDKRDDGQVRGDNATTDGLSLALTLAARAVGGVTLAQKKANTVGKKDTLLHGETLLIVTTRDTENVTLELIANGVTRNFSGHTLIHEDTAAGKRFQANTLVALFLFWRIPTL